MRGGSRLRTFLLTMFRTFSAIANQSFSLLSCTNGFVIILAGFFRWFVTLVFFDRIGWIVTGAAGSLDFAPRRILYPETAKTMYMLCTGGFLKSPLCDGSVLLAVLSSKQVPVHSFELFSAVLCKKFNVRIFDGSAKSDLSDAFTASFWQYTDLIFFAHCLEHRYCKLVLQIWCGDYRTQAMELQLNRKFAQVSSDCGKLPQFWDLKDMYELL